MLRFETRNRNAAEDAAQGKAFDDVRRIARNADGELVKERLIEDRHATHLGESLGELDRETPRLHFVKKNVPCSWHAKGRVMRRLMKDSEALPRDLIEGVKIYPKSMGKLTSILLNPDRARNVFHINAESSDPDIAERLATEYEAKVLGWIRVE